MLLAPLMLVALALFGFRGTPLSLPLSVWAASSSDGAELSQPGSAPVDASQSQPSIASDQPLEAGPPGLDAKVTEWIASLASQSPYASWTDANRAVYPLGPGTHSWLVLLTASGQELGYMIVATDKQGGAYSLVEYGTGGNPLYSLNTLYQGLIRHEIIDPHLSYDAFVKNDLVSKSRVYLGPLHSFWKVTIRTDSLYFDAKTGELLPNMEEQLASKPDFGAKGFLSPKGSVTKSVSAPAFDPFEKASWLKPNAPALTLKRDVTLMLEHRDRLTYTAKLFGGKLTYALALTGYDEWSEDSLFVRLDQDGDRVVSLDSLLALGRITY